MTTKPYDYMYLVEANIKALEKMRDFFHSPDVAQVHGHIKAYEIGKAIELLKRIDQEGGDDEIRDDEVDVPAAFGYIASKLTNWWD